MLTILISNRLKMKRRIFFLFQAFKQVSPKNDYQYGFSMVFANQADYTTYNEHPDHVAFVQDRWMKEVSAFLEIDFEKPF